MSLRWVRVDLPDGRILAIGYAGDDAVECNVIGKHGECSDCGRPLIIRRARDWGKPHTCEHCATLAIAEALSARRERR